MKNKEKWYNDEDLNNFPFRKTKRIRNDNKRYKVKNNRSGTQGGRTTDHCSEGEDY